MRFTPSFLSFILFGVAAAVAIQEIAVRYAGGGGLGGGLGGLGVEQFLSYADPLLSEPSGVLKKTDVIPTPSSGTFHDTSTGKHSRVFTTPDPRLIAVPTSSGSLSGSPHHRGNSSEKHHHSKTSGGTDPTAVPTPDPHHHGKSSGKHSHTAPFGRTTPTADPISPGFSPSGSRHHGNFTGIESPPATSGGAKPTNVGAHTSAPQSTDAKGPHSPHATSTAVSGMDRPEHTDKPSRPRGSHKMHRHKQTGSHGAKPTMGHHHGAHS